MPRLIRYLYRSVPVTTLVALYRATGVLAITPVRERMNPVAEDLIARCEHASIT